MAKQGEGNHERIRADTRDIVIVDGHAHNLVDLDSSFSFLHAFCGSRGRCAGGYPSHNPIQEDVAGLYEIDASLKSIEEHRKVVELRVLSEKCFEAANIGTVLLDDGITFDRMKALSWHRDIIKNVHRILRIETVAEDLLRSYSVDIFFERKSVYTLFRFGDRLGSAFGESASSSICFGRLTIHHCPFGSATCIVSLHAGSNIPCQCVSSGIPGFCPRDPKAHGTGYEISSS